MQIKSFFSGLILTFVASSVLSATAIPYPNPGQVAPEMSFQATHTGDVIAYFYGSTAMFTEELGLLVNGVQQGGWALENHSSQFGQKFDFGHVQAGDTLTFALKVNDTGYTLYSTASMNPDGLNHAYSTSFTREVKGNAYIPSGTFVGFEDSLAGFSDFNYNDEDFVFRNVTATATPEPASLLLFAMGLLGFGALGYRANSRK